MKSGSRYGVRRAGAALTACVLGGAAVLLGSAPASATVSSAAVTSVSGWVGTATKALDLVQATSLGAPAAGTPLRLTVGLTPQNRAGLDSLIKAQATPGSAQYEKFLTADQFTAEFGATQAHSTAVAQYLAAAGMTNVTVAANRLQVTADSTVSQAQNAFHTTIGSFQQFGQTVLANTAAALVPASLTGMVSAVLGLSTIKEAALPPVTLPNLAGYHPAQFNRVYHSWGTKAGDGTPIAVIAQGDLTQTVKDLRKAETAQKLRQVPVSLVYAGIASPDKAGADEWDLDTQTSTGVAPNTSRLYIYIATSLTDADLARAINLFVTQNVARAGSASLGECDALAMTDGSTTIDDIAFAQGAVQGQTFFASSGDTGSSCAVLPTNGVPGSGPTDTEYPSSSTYVVGVGGTTLAADSNGNYNTEVAWNSGGGGLSPVEFPGYWTDTANKASADNLRGVPDVAFDADPTTGALIYVNGVVQQIGGTSLSAPLALGLWARVMATHSNKLGFAAPKLYGLYNTAAAASTTGIPTTVPGFHDIVLGSNGAYSATIGYDYTTGLGSWDVGALSVAIK